MYGISVQLCTEIPYMVSGEAVQLPSPGDAVEFEDGSLLVIHAMPLRDRYRKQYEEVKDGEGEENDG
jgi:hypothetical protein